MLTIKMLKVWFVNQMFLLACWLIKKSGGGFSVVRIVQKAGTMYIQDRDGTMRKIGR